MKDLGMLRRAGWLGWSGWAGWWLGAVVLGMVLPVYGQYGPGTGEPNDPYQIWDPNQMNAIGANPGDWGKCFKLMADIDLGGLGSDGFQMIGVYVGPNNTSNIPFSGKFDGNGHSISNFTYISDRNVIGLFSYVAGTDAMIENLTLIDPNLEGRNITGGLVGLLEYGTISDCRVENCYIPSSYFESMVGSLAGSSNNGTIINCHAEGGFLFGRGYTGGLVGANNTGSRIHQCSAKIDVRDVRYAGGLVGTNNYGTITNSFAQGEVTCRRGNAMGGLVGVNKGQVDRCWAEGLIKSEDYDYGISGGLIGENNGTLAEITNSYANSIVLGDWVGGLVGYNYGGSISSCYSTSRTVPRGTSPEEGGLVAANYAGQVINSFWDRQASGLDHSDGGTSLTAAEMVDKSIFESAGWDFSTSIWRMEDGLTCPILAWEDPNDKISYGGGTGSAGDPYRIYTPEQMQEIGLHKFHWNKHFQLMNDIDIGCYDGREGREAFHLISMPISFMIDQYTGYRYPLPFLGSFNGDGHSIYNFTWNDESLPTEISIGLYVWNIGLFCEVGSTGEIRNLGLEDVDLFASISYSMGHTLSYLTKAIGGIVGENQGIISDCQVTGRIEVTGQNSCGGIAGFNHNGGVIQNCWTRMELVGNYSGNDFGKKMGGIVGGNGRDEYEFTEISDCEACYIHNCYVLGTFSITDYPYGGAYIGGIAGLNFFNSEITNSYSLAELEGKFSGGIAGVAFGNSAISNCYAAGYLSGEYAGGIAAGLVEYNSPPVLFENCFWDVTACGVTKGVGYLENDPNGVVGLDTAEMMMESTFTGVGWDFTEGDGDGAEWMMLREGEDYPRLAWQEVYGGDIAGLYGVGLEDLLEVAGNWLEEGCPAGCEGADIDGDGRVDLGDFAILAGNWLKE